MTKIGTEGAALATQWDDELHAHGHVNYGSLKGTYRGISEILEVDGMLDSIKGLSPKVRSYILDLILLGMGTENMNSHLDVLELAGWPDFVEVDSDFSQLEELNSNLQKASDNNRIYSTMSPSFKSIMTKIFALEPYDEYTIGQFERGEVLILRSVFGEETITELLMRGSAEGYGRPPLTNTELVILLEDWDNLKHFPIDWALELAVTKNKSVLVSNTVRSNG